MAKQISTHAQTQPIPPKPQQFDMQTLKRVFGYMKNYKHSLILVVICILLSSIASAVSSMFLQTLIDDHIVPLLAMENPVFTGLIHALITVGCIYFAGVIASLIYNRLMVTIAQGTLKKIRDEMFSKMQWLPIRYFDTHTHGETMSLYTNDTDTLRQLIAQAMPNLVSSVFTIIAVFICMLYISIPLTLLALFTMWLVMRLAGGTMGRIGFYFMEQQKTLADLNGFVEEMINGQKVIKVFTHEDHAKAQLAHKNKLWEEAASLANGNANSMMPMMNALGYMQYVIVAILGAWMAISETVNLGLTGTNILTLGSIASFLTLTRNFTNPISQISNQFNSIVTALAGASRIFAFMDETPEIDEGYVTLA